MPSSLAGAASTMTMTTLPAPAYFDLLPDELIETIIDRLQDDYCCRDVLALGLCDRRLAALVRSKQWQVIDAQQFTRGSGHIKLFRRGHLVRKVLIPLNTWSRAYDLCILAVARQVAATCTEVCVILAHQGSDALPEQSLSCLAPHLRVLTIRFMNWRDRGRISVRGPSQKDLQSLCSLLSPVRGPGASYLHESSVIPQIIAKCRLLNSLHLELCAARAHAFHSSPQLATMPSELVRLELRCESAPLGDLSAFLADPAASCLTTLKISATSFDLPGQMYATVLPRLASVELVMSVNSATSDTRTDWPALVFSCLFDPTCPIENLGLHVFSTRGILTTVKDFERAQPVKTLKQVRILAVQGNWSSQFSSDFEALANKLRAWTAQTGVQTEVIR